MHDWDLTPSDAAEAQKRLASSVHERPLLKPVHRIAGVDVSIRAGQAHAAVVVLSLPELKVEDRATYTAAVRYPYVPGLLAFREIPPVLASLEKLCVPFDVLMVDGHGRVHPRRFGLACHLGVLLNVPVAGVAKRPYIGKHGSLPPHKGATRRIRDPETGEVLGMAVRTRRDVRPVYTSIGHKMTLADAVWLTLCCTTRYRIPEPTRQAHLLSRA